MTQRKTTLLIVAGVLGVSALFVGALMVPGHRKLSERQAQLVTAANEVRDLQQDLGSVSDLYASILTLDQQMADDRQRLPAERSVGDFLSDLADALGQCQIVDFVVQPQPVMEVRADLLPPSHSVAAGTIVIPFKLAFEGTFAQAFDIMAKIERFRRSTHVAGLNIMNEKDRLGRVQVEIMLHTYQHGG